MQISEPAGGVPAAGNEPCRFPKLEECAHFHYERVQLPQLTLTLQTSMDQSLHSQHSKYSMVSKSTQDNCICMRYQCHTTCVYVFSKQTFEKQFYSNYIRIVKLFLFLLECSNVSAIISNRIFQGKKRDR